VSSNLTEGTRNTSSEQFYGPLTASGTIRRVSVTVGEAFAGYTILQLLGSGGMADVYLAQHPRLPRRDALKLRVGQRRGP
jgi:serine/threonine protein kinase